MKNFFIMNQGSKKDPVAESSEKLLLFLVLEGEEIPYFQCVRSQAVKEVFSLDDNRPELGLGRTRRSNPEYYLTHDEIWNYHHRSHLYSTAATYGKLFVSQSGFGVPKRWQAFYFKFMEPPHPPVNLMPFGNANSTKTPQLFFRGRISFLKPQDVYALFPEDAQPLKFYANQPKLAADVIRSIIKVDRAEQTANLNVRVLKIGSKR